ncbi:sulfurtransferase [Neobacillus mesonae]|uniref:Sulfurtransferase n=1 Tax=Neobacillus mesonae TaxID=1193713 RepID=A0A3T0I170_9BACI|nr:sulfurtransferase [Neobacillus mesonae]AZU63089.1 sulfurtransferase [Neobacillus mesonae]
MKYLVDHEWLFNHLHDSRIRIVDCRFSLADKEKGHRDYTEGHIPGAVFFDIEKDLSSPVGVHGGRHPMPDLDEFIHKLGEAGIDETVTVIAYDNGEGAFAGRFWWLLQYLGHEQVFVLNGGFKQWKEAGSPITADVPSFDKVQFHSIIREEFLADVEEVRAVSAGKKDAVLIDSREAKRYLGIEEPIDKKAGHIPGAINKPFIEGFETGKFKSAAEHKERFADVDPEKQIIVYCGSGITATPNFLALKEAGFEKVKLYLGSFSDWISYEDNKID